MVVVVFFKSLLRVSLLLLLLVIFRGKDDTEKRTLGVTYSLQTNGFAIPSILPIRTIFQARKMRENYESI